MNQKHFKNIIKCYSIAPINKIFKPRMNLGLGKCEIKMRISKSFHHSANSLHGSIYFKMLDDAAWGASNTYVDDVFLFTYNFDIYLKKPISSGIIIARGEVLNKKDNKFKAKSYLYDSKNNEIAHGEGLFMRSNYLLSEAIGLKKI